MPKLDLTLHVLTAVGRLSERPESVGLVVYSMTGLVMVVCAGKSASLHVRSVPLRIIPLACQTARKIVHFRPRVRNVDMEVLWSWRWAYVCYSMPSIHPLSAEAAAPSLLLLAGHDVDFNARGQELLIRREKSGRRGGLTSPEG